MYSLINLYDIYKKRTICPEELCYYKNESNFENKKKGDDHYHYHDDSDNENENIIFNKRKENRIFINEIVKDYKIRFDESEEDEKNNVTPLPPIFKDAMLKIVIVNYKNIIDIYSTKFSYILEKLPIETLLIININNTIFNNEMKEILLPFIHRTFKKKEREDGEGEGERDIQKDNNKDKCKDKDEEQQKKQILYDFCGNYISFINKYDAHISKNIFFSYIVFIPAAYFLENKNENVEILKALLDEKKLCFVLCCSCNKVSIEGEQMLHLLKRLDARLWFQPLPNYYSIKIEEKNFAKKLKWKLTQSKEKREVEEGLSKIYNIQGNNDENINKDANNTNKDNQDKDQNDESEGNNLSSSNNNVLLEKFAYIIAFQGYLKDKN